MNGKERGLMFGDYFTFILLFFGVTGSQMWTQCFFSLSLSVRVLFGNDFFRRNLYLSLLLMIHFHEMSWE